MSKADERPLRELGANLSEPTPLQFPSDWTYTQSWRRAQTETDQGGPLNDAERIVMLEDGNPHRVVFTLHLNTLVCNCDCKGYEFRSWCAHVAKCWFDWIRGAIAVHHLQTGATYTLPPQWLELGGDQ